MHTMTLFDEITQIITYKSNRVIQSIKIEEAPRGAIEEFLINIRILNLDKDGQFEGGVKLPFLETCQMYKSNFLSGYLNESIVLYE